MKKLNIKLIIAIILPTIIFSIIFLKPNLYDNILNTTYEFDGTTNFIIKLEKLIDITNQTHIMIGILLIIYLVLTSLISKKIIKNYNQNHSYKIKLTENIFDEKEETYNIKCNNLTYLMTLLVTTSYIVLIIPLTIKNYNTDISEILKTTKENNKEITITAYISEIYEPTIGSLINLKIDYSVQNIILTNVETKEAIVTYNYDQFEKDGLSYKIEDENYYKNKNYEEAYAIALLENNKSYNEEFKEEFEQYEVTYIEGLNLIKTITKIEKNN